MAYQDSWSDPNDPNQPIFQYQPNAGSGMYEQGGFTGQANVPASQIQTPQYQYQQQAPGQQSTQPSQAGSNPFSAGMSPEQFRGAMNQFAGSRGYGPVSDSSYNTWQGYYNDYGQNNPDYLWMRMQDTGEFGGADTYGRGGGAGGGAYVLGQGVPGMGSALGGAWGGRANSLYEQLMGLAQQTPLNF